MPVPFIDLKRFETGFFEQWMETVERLSRNTAFIGGEEVQKLEASLAADNKVSHAIGCANGTDALQLALRAVGVGPGDIVLLPDLTFWATFEAIVNVGGTPVTIDVDTTDLQMDFDLFVQAVETHKPKAAMLVHLYGWASARLDDFRSFCREKNIPLVEDGAQSYGVTWKGESIYKDAMVSTISFYPAKVLGAAGDAGAVLASDEDLAKKIRSLGNHGRAEHYTYSYVGWNSRMDSFQAAYLNLSLPHLPERIKSRVAMAHRYRQHSPDTLTTVVPPANFEENGYLNVTLAPPGKRDAILSFLKEKGIGTGIVYPSPMSAQEGAKGLIGGTVGQGRATDICDRVFSLPLFAYMTDAECSEVSAALAEAVSA